jgi:hypothetical protein
VKPRRHGSNLCERRSLSLMFMALALVAAVIPAGARAQTRLAGQPAAPAGVVDVASCESFLVSVGSDSGNAQIGCQAIGTLAQTVNQPYSTVFGCGWVQATAMGAGGQPSAAAMITCLGLGG